MERKGKLIFFDIKTDTKCIIKDGNEFKEDNANIKFIRDFTKKDLLATENLLGWKQQSFNRSNSWFSWGV